MTLGTVLPDYVQRMGGAGRVARGQIAWLPVLTAAAALVASSLAQAPNFALYAVVAVASLITNAAANTVGPIAALASRGASARTAAVAVSLAAAAAAPLVLTWQQVVAVASWAIGLGSLLVAPVAGVVLADYWVCRARVIDRAALEVADRQGAYHYWCGINPRAVAAFVVGMAPDLVSVAAGFESMFGGSAAKGTEAYLSAYVVNMEYSAILGAGLSFFTYLLLSVVATPDSLKIARAEAAAMSGRERRVRQRASETAAPSATPAPAPAPPQLAAPAPVALVRPVVEGEIYVDDSASVAAAKVSPASSSLSLTSSSAASDATTTSSVTTSESTEDTETITTTVVTKTVTRKDNAYVREARARALPPPRDDLADLDLAAVQRFYRELTARVRDALAPARAAQGEADAALASISDEQREMLEGHAADGGSMTMAEVRYETMKMTQLIAEAEVASARVADELAEAWAFFEAEGAGDCAAIEARLDLNPLRHEEAREGTEAGGDLVIAVYVLSAARRRRERDARTAAEDAAAAARNASAAARTATASAARASDELRAEDESRVFLRNWALAVGTWVIPPILEVPMLPMSDAETRLREREEARRVEYELSSRAAAEEEGRRRSDEDARRDACEEDVRRRVEDESRVRAAEEARRRVADDDVDRLRAIVSDTTETIEVTRRTVTKQSTIRTAEERGCVEREEARRAVALLEIERVRTDIAEGVVREQTRRLEFDQRLSAMATEEDTRRAAEVTRRAAFDEETTRLQTEEDGRRDGEDAARAAARSELDAARETLAAIVAAAGSRRAEALDIRRALVDEEGAVRAKEDARRADANRLIAAAAMEERARLLAEEDERRAVENARRADAADAAGERARVETGAATAEDMRRADADDAVRAAADAIEDLERDAAVRRAGFDADADARKRTIKDADDADFRRRDLVEAEISAAAEAEARARAEEDARALAAAVALTALEAQGAAALEGEDSRRADFSAETLRLAQENEAAVAQEERRREQALAALTRAVDEERRRRAAEGARRVRAEADAEKAAALEVTRAADEEKRRAAAAVGVWGARVRL
jgi:hypothetical protein